MRNEPELAYKCAGPVVGVFDEADIKAVETEEAKETIRKKIGFKKRQWCGNDITSLITSIPADGKSYDVECPVCGAVGPNSRKPLADKENSKES